MFRWERVATRWHWRWRSGGTWLDRANGNCYEAHHGFYSVEYRRRTEAERAFIIEWIAVVLFVALAIATLQAAI